MRFAIVGGGISGCLSALHLLNEGHQVTVYEAGETLGGILLDINTQKGKFLRNTQYFDMGTKVIDILQTVEELKLTIFPHRYGSWNDLFGEVVVHHDFSQLVVPGSADLRFDLDSIIRDVVDRVGSYEPRVSTPLLKWLSRFGSLAQLDADNCSSLQAERIFYRDEVEAVRQAKLDSAIANELLGLPRSKISPPTLMQESAIPTAGFDDFFEVINGALLDRGAEIFCNSPVKAVLKEEESTFSVRRKTIEADWMVWCANPTPLLHNLVGERLDSPVIRCFNLVATVCGNLPEDPVYYQTFSMEHPLLRVFAYNISNVPCVTVEGLDEGWSLGRLIETSNRIMNDIGWDVRIKEASFIPQLRYTLLTLDDIQRFNRFSEVAPKMRVITGGWEYYGRDMRLESILGKLNGLSAI